MDPAGPTGQLTLDATAVLLLDAVVPAVPDAGPHDPRLRLLALRARQPSQSGSASGAR
jgi:hypothetical protein